MRQLLVSWADTHGRKGLAVLWLSLASLVTCLVYTGLIVTRPPMGLELKGERAGVSVAHTDWYGVAATAGIEPGDIVLAVNGLPADVVYARLLRGDPLAIEQVSVVSPGGQPKAASVHEFGPLPHSVAVGAILSFIGLLSWAVGVFVYLKKPGEQAALLLLWLGNTGAVALSVEQGIFRGIPGARELVFASLAMLPGMFAHLFWVFPARAGWQPRRPLSPWLFHGPGLLVLFGYLLWGRTYGEWYALIRALLLLNLAAGLLAGAGGIVHSWVAATSPRARTQVRMIVAGILVGVLPFACLSVLPQALGRESLLHPEVGVLGLVLVPLSLAYAILRHRLMDIEVFVRRGLVYAMLTGVLAGAYLLFTAALDALAISIGGTSSLWAFAFFSAVVTLSFVPARAKLQELVDRVIYKDRYDYQQTLRELSTSLSSLTDEDSVASVVVDTIAHIMRLSGACLLLPQPGGGYTTKRAVGPYFADGPQPLSLGGLARQPRVRDEEFRSLEELEDGSVVIPLRRSDGEVLAVLWLGPKASRSEFTGEDLSLICTVANAAGIAFENARLIRELRENVAALRDYSSSLRSKERELRRLSARLVEAQEDERKRLALELHDETLQKVLYLVRQGEMCLELAETNGRKSRDELAKLVELARDAEHELRTICSQLRPAILDDLGLVPALEWLGFEVERNSNLKVEPAFCSSLEEERLSPAVEVTLYRVAQECLANVRRHAAASEVRMSLTVENGCVRLGVEDNGQGFGDMRSPAELLKDGHLGIAGMGERLKQMGGKLQIDSRVGKGTSVLAIVPLSSRGRGETDGEDQNPVG